MKQFLDFLPLIVFFAFYKLYDIYVASGALIVATALALVFTWVKYRKVEKMTLITFLMVLVFGTLTLVFHNDLFIKWKVTVIYALFALALLISLLAAYVVYLLTANRMSLSYHIGHAITHREFRVYCQPIIHSDTGRCAGVEMLLRWKKKRQGWISPDVFIPLAEQHELIIPLTRYLMSTVTENLQLFPPRPSFYISINVAAEHFKTLNIIDDIRQIWLPAHPMPSLMLELTERTALSAIQYDQIRTLKDMGIMLAIDDFGTGHSSLSYLKNLSPDVLKIDRGFTAAIGTDAVNATVTDTIITLAQRLKLKLVAEGVETEEQADYLRSREVNALQGYYFAKPMPIHVFPLWLQQYESRVRKAEEDPPEA